MAFVPAGRARFESEIADLSILVATGLRGIAAVAGVTAWGEIGKSQLVGTWEEYKKYFGGFLALSDFPVYCKYMLDRGAKLRITPIRHFTDVSDKSTVDATKSTGNTTTSAVAETLAESTQTITTVGATNDVYSISTGGYTWTYTQQAGDTPTLVAVGLKNAINALSVVHGYVATNASGVVTTKAPVGTGATANGQAVAFTKTGGTGAITKTNFSGGVTALLYSGSIDIESAFATDALDNSQIVVKDAATGAAGKIDIDVVISGFPSLNTQVKNLNRTFTDADKDKFNLASTHIKITSYSGDIANGTTVLSGGALNISGINDVDYIGDAGAGTGIHGFDNDTDFWRIAVPEKATQNIDNALALYVEARQDCRSILRTPMGISGTLGIDYREKTNVFSGGTAIDSWRLSMTYGENLVAHPVTGLPVSIPAVCAWLVAGAYTDNKSYAWFASAGQKRGRIAGTLGVEYNLASPARTTEFDNVDVHGLNALVDDPDYGVVCWGNSTLQKADTLLKHENVANLMIFLSRSIRPLAKSELFDPNDIETWKAIYRKVKRLMDFVQKKRGVWKWKYEGDQDIQDVSEAKVNDPNNIDSGQYVFNLWTAPKVGMKYAGMRVVVTNSGVSFEALSAETTF